MWQNTNRSAILGEYEKEPFLWYDCHIFPEILTKINVLQIIRIYYILHWILFRCQTIHEQSSNFLFAEFVANKIVENLSSNAIQVLQVNVDHLNDSQLVEYVLRAFKETENMTLICNNACTERIMKLVSVSTYSIILYVLIYNPCIWFVFIYNLIFVLSFLYNITFDIKTEDGPSVDICCNKPFDYDFYTRNRYRYRKCTNTTFKFTFVDTKLCILIGWNKSMNTNLMCQDYDCRT